MFVELLSSPFPVFKFLKLAYIKMRSVVQVKHASAKIVYIDSHYQGYRQKNTSVQASAHFQQIETVVLAW